MTKRELSQVYYLNKEIQIHEARLQGLKRQFKRLKTVDGVKASSKESPFTLHNKRIEGVRPTAKNKEAVRIMAERRALISQLKTQCEKEQQRLERYIMTIPDSFMRQLIILRFVDLREWKDIAAIVGGNNSEDSVRMAVDRFLRDR